MGALPVSRTGAGSGHSATVPSASEAAIRPWPSQVTEVTGCGWASVAVIARVARFHTSTLAPEVPSASDRPSGLKATVFAQSVAPASVPSLVAARRFARTDHSQTLLSFAGRGQRRSRQG